MNRIFSEEVVGAPNREELREACLVGDGHIVPPAASHLFRKQGEIVGAVSLFTPVAMFWAHSQKLKPVESFELVKRCQAMASLRNPNYYVACSAESPFRPAMEKHFGYRLIGGVEVFEVAR